jgi:hypothetical protein
MNLEPQTRALILRTAAVVVGLGWLGIEATRGSWFMATAAGLVVVLGIVDFMASGRE